MKVKKKYLVTIFSVFFLGLITISAIILYLANKINIGYNDSQNYVESGFAFNLPSKNRTDNYNPESQKLIDILHYEINLEIFADEEKIIGKTIIKGIPKNENVENIEINFDDDLEIVKIKFNEKSVDYLFEDNIIQLRTSGNINDTFRVEVDYKGTPESLGFGSFNFSEHNEETVVYSLSEPIYASTWFPCVDRPADKVFADILITNDSSKISVSNGILVSEKTIGNRKTYHWRTKYPIATYLISIYSANYKFFKDEYISISEDTMRIDYYVFEDHFENAKRDFSIHKNAFSYFESLFGQYPFIDEKYGVAEFMWSYGAMEHQTITGIGSNFITGNKFFTGMLVHELAHQWWGNSVTLMDWRDIWLNEGFATYSEALYWEKEKGISALKSTMEGWNRNFDGTTLYNPDELFSRIVYNKGAWVLHMLRREIGEEKFFKLLREYYNSFKYGNASTKDFMTIAENISGKSLSQFFKQWIYEGKGKLEIEFNYIQNSVNELELEIIQVQNGFYEYNFLLDIEFTLNNDSKINKTIRVSKRKQSNIFKFGKKILKLDLDPDDWLAAEIKNIEKSKK